MRRDGDLDANERAKSHPLRATKFNTAELAVLKANLLDGGGVLEDGELLRRVLQAVVDEDWNTVFKEIPHVLKSWFKQRGAVIPAPTGGVMLKGVGPAAGPNGQEALTHNKPKSRGLTDV